MALRVLYPPQCVSCGALVEMDFGLCGACWKEAPFIAGCVCDLCGLPLPGGDEDEIAQCDECLASGRRWQKGRAAMLYHGKARDLVLKLKHSDRHDVVRPAVQWMTRTARPLVRPNMLVSPIPLHWIRMVRRRYNQSALLAERLAKTLDLEYCPDLLVRPRATMSLDGKSRDERFATLNDAIQPNPKRVNLMVGRPILLVDDVLTSGATFTAATAACEKSQAGDIHVIALARVAKRA